jgi:hypothetical protein
MATRDLIGELKQSASIEQSLQVPVRNAILAQLDDKAPDVSTIAVKWYGCDSTRYLVSSLF